MAAGVFAAVTLVYAIVWTSYANRAMDRAFLGVVVEYDGWTRSFPVAGVRADAPAEAAGIRKGDAIVAVEGLVLDTPNPFYDHVTRAHPGDAVRLTLRRSGSAAPVEVEARLVSLPETEAWPSSRTRQWAMAPLQLYPVPFALVAAGVLALRPDAAHAWLFALSLAGLGVGPLEPVAALLHPALRRFSLTYSVLVNGPAPVWLYLLLATFPSRSPLDRRAPWLKPLFVILGAALWLPVSVSTLLWGSAWPFVRWLRPSGAEAFDLLTGMLFFGAMALALLSLALNCRPSIDPPVRRKARLVAWSLAVGLVPWTVLIGVGTYLGKGIVDLPFWFWVPSALLAMLAPLLFAYAVVRHRVLDFSMLVRRSARYVLVQRGFVLLAIALTLVTTLVFVTSITRVLPRLTDAALPVGIVMGTVFGLVLFRTGGALAGQVTRRIDRAFFRSAYDARRILEDLAQQSALVSSRDELARLMDRELHDALHPSHMAIYLRDEADVLRRSTGDRTSEVFDAPLLVDRLEREGHALDPAADQAAQSALSAFQADCVVPMLTRRNRLVGALVLGARLSEEPYSREDKALLMSVAGQAASALENLILARQMAERLESERRAAHEVEIAARVQRRLLPVGAASLTTLEYTGRCLQARAVGGDYYDFLDLGAGGLGFVIGDVSGKGLYAALLMAHLQASLRSLSARLAAEDLPAVLRSLNHAFCEATAGNHFATLFVGLYDDSRRHLRYANCGHHPPMLLRGNGEVERLEVTAGAIGFFDQWACHVNETSLSPGDLLALFSDGVTEAMSAAGEEFGEARLVDVLAVGKHRPLAALADEVINAVRTFSGPEQTDDLTIVVLRAR